MPKIPCMLENNRYNSNSDTLKIIFGKTVKKGSNRRHICCKDHRRLFPFSTVLPKIIFSVFYVIFIHLNIRAKFLLNISPLKIELIVIIF